MPPDRSTMGSGNNSYPVPNFSPNGLKIAAFHSYVFFTKFARISRIVSGDTSPAFFCTVPKLIIVSNILQKTVKFGYVEMVVNDPLLHNVERVLTSDYPAKLYRLEVLN